MRYRKWVRRVVMAGLGRAITRICRVAPVKSSPGVIDTSTNYVEHPDLVAQRIIRFADALGRERIIASTDCGFATSAGYGKIDPEVAFLKLRSLVCGAAQASRRLWGASSA